MRPQKMSQDNEIAAIQKILDESDIFLVESLSQKTDEQLMRTMEACNKHLEIARSGGNLERIETAKNTLQTVKAYIRMKGINEQIKKDLTDDSDSTGGVTLV